MNFMCISVHAVTIKVGQSTTLTGPTPGSSTGAMYSWTVPSYHVSTSSATSKTITVTGTSAGTVTLSCTVKWQTYNSTTKSYVYESSNVKTQSYTVTVTEDSGGSESSDNTTPTSISLNYTSVSLQVGGTRQLSATVSPSGSSQSVTWSVPSGSSYVSVSSSGLVTAKATGTATVRATSTVNNSVYKNCTVTVTEPTSSIVAGTWSGNTLTIDANATLSGYAVPYSNFYKYSATQMLYTPTEIDKSGTINSIAFKVADASSFSTSEVKVYLGHKSGTFSSSSNYVASSNLTLVYSGTPTLGQTTGWETLTFNQGTFNYNGTDNLVVVVTRKSDNYTNGLKYYYYNTGSGYTLYRQDDSDAGYGDVTNTSNGYSTSTNRPAIRMVFATPPTSISLNSTNVSLEVGETKQLTATVLPNSALQSVTWSVYSGSSYASVSSSGLVTAKALGTATIRAISTVNSAVYKNCIVTVTGSLESISLPESIQMSVGETQTLTPMFTPASAAMGVTWSSEDESIATVDEYEGVVTAVSPGTTTIYVVADDAEHIASCNVTVTGEDAPLKDGDYFTANTVEGVEMSFQVLSTSLKYCTVYGKSSNPAIPTTTLGEVTIPSEVNGFTVVEIRSEAFKNCTNLTAVNIPNSVMEISRSAFYGCSGITSIAIPNSVQRIGRYAFANCTALTTISLPNILAKIGDSAFKNTAWYNNLPDGMAYIGKVAYKYKGTMPDNTSIELIEGTIGIGSDAFVNYTDQSSIIPNTGLSSIIIPNSVTYIGLNAFQGCNNLTTVTLGMSTPPTIYAQTFPNRTNATLYVPYGCKATYEAADAWKEFKEIIEMKPAELKDGDTFEESAMTYQVISASDKTVKLTRGANTGSIVNIPSEVYGYKVTAIGKAAFRELNNISAVTIPSSVVTIERSVFDDCTNLTSVSIPSSVTSIGEKLFTGCKQLTSVTVANDNPVYDSRNDCNAIMETATNTLVVGCIASVIPESVVKIGAKAFEDIRGLVSISIPEGVARIEEMAFIDCSNLEEITLPSSLTYIAEDAFSECPSITKVTSLITNPFTINKWTFGVEDSNYTNNFNPVVYNNATLYVPYGCKAAYQAETYWKEFKEIVEMDVVETDISTMEDIIYANALTASKGSNATLTICLKNAQATSGYSFDLVLPNGVSLAKDSESNYLYELSSRHNGHSESVNYNETTGVYSFAVLSLQSKEIKESDGAIWTLKLKLADNVAVGNYAVKIQNAKYSLTSGASSVALPDVTSLLTVENYIKGDANGDGMVDIADAVCIVNHIVGKATPAYVAAAADANGDGVVDIADAVRIVNLIVGKITTLAPKLEFTLLEPQ